MNPLLRSLFTLGIAGQCLAADPVPRPGSPGNSPSTRPNIRGVMIPGQSDDDFSNLPPYDVRGPWKIVEICSGRWLMEISPDGSVRMSEFGPANPHMAWARTGVVSQKQVELALLAERAHPPSGESTQRGYAASISMSDDVERFMIGGRNIAIWNDLVAKVVPALEGRQLPLIKELLKQSPPEIPDQSDDDFSDLPPFDLRRPWKIVEICCGQWFIRISPDGSVRMSELNSADPHMAWVRSGVVSQKQIELVLLADWARPPSEENTRPGFEASISMSDDEWSFVKDGRNIAIWNDLMAKVVPALEGPELPLIRELLKQFPPEIPLRPEPPEK